MSRLHVLYVGSIVPDVALFHTRAFNRAANMFQANLLAGMVDAGVDVTILSQRPWRLFPRSRQWRFGTEVVDLSAGLRGTMIGFLNLPNLRPISVGLRVMWEARRWRRRLPPSARAVVYTYNLTEPPGTFTLAAARLIGARAVASVNDVFIPGQLIPDTLPRRIDFALQRWIMPRYDGLVVVTEAIAEDLAPQVPRIRVEGGITEEMLEVRPKRAVVPGEPVTFALVASLEEHNGIRQTLDAFQATTNPNLRLVVAGNGALTPFAEAAAKADPRVTYAGFLGFDEVLRLYENVDALVSMRLMTKMDTRYFFPSKLMEFLASGVPVITTPHAGVREEFSDAAFILDDDSPEALARMFDTLSATPPAERFARGDRARAILRATRMWPIQARRVAEFVERVAGWQAGDAGGRNPCGTM
jgi:glycosyltransferase involved in cell wall biosynthesis